MNEGRLVIGGGSLNCVNGFLVDKGGKLEMINSQDNVIVGGNFTTVSNRSHEGILTKGVLEIRGNFNQSGNKNSFLCSGDHRTVLNAKTLSSGRIMYQSLVFSNPGDSKFN